MRAGPGILCARGSTRSPRSFPPGSTSCCIRRAARPHRPTRALPPTPRPTRRAQVKRFANFYFLVVGAMQCMPWISLSDGVPGIYMPLLIIICIDLGIMGHEDYHR